MWGWDAGERNSLRTQQWPHKLQHQTNSPPLLEQIKSSQTTTNPRKMKLDIVFWITPRRSHLCVLCIPPSPSTLRKPAYIHDVKNIICWAKLKKKKSPLQWEALRSESSALAAGCTAGSTTVAGAARTEASFANSQLKAGQWQPEYITKISSPPLMISTLGVCMTGTRWNGSRDGEIGRGWDTGWNDSKRLLLGQI